jgi:Fic family protein
VDSYYTFYLDAPPAMLPIKNEARKMVMALANGVPRSKHDIAVGRHLLPSSERGMAFFAIFRATPNLSLSGGPDRILAIPAGHHRLKYIHSFPDENGRVSR